LDSKTLNIAKNNGTTNQICDIHDLKETMGISLVRIEKPIQLNCISRAMDTGCLSKDHGSFPFCKKRSKRKKVIPAKIGSVGKLTPRLKVESFKEIDKGVIATTNNKRLFKW
jgi:hypothetical protein